MRPEIVLTISHAQEPVRDHSVDSNRFTIGRSSDNDLAIDDPSLSRRHALIECFDGQAQLSDCGSENGTFLNGGAVTRPTVLRDGDVISIGSDYHLTVHVINAAGVDARANQTRKNDDSPPSLVAAQGAPKIVAAAVSVIIIAAALIIVASRSHEPGSTKTKPNAADQVDKPDGSGSGGSSGAVLEQGRDNTGRAVAISDSQVESAAVQVMRRISTDESKYTFQTTALNEIRLKVEEYRASPGLAGVLQALADRGSDMTKQARREGIPPAIVLYTGLAETDGGRTGRDPIAASQKALPDLLWLNVTFGTKLADESLIIVAAYKLGTGTKKSHPLLAKLQQAPLGDRNIWYLRQRGLLQTEAYDFVIKFLALGVLAQNPGLFGVPAAAPAF